MKFIEAQQSPKLGESEMRLRATPVIGLLMALPIWAQAQPLPSWADQMEALKPVGEELLVKAGRGDTEARRQEMYKYILGTVANGFLNYVNQDLAHPTFVPLWNHALNYGGANPDYAYMMTLVDPNGVYRISGYRGTSRFVEITQTPGDQAPPVTNIKVPATNDLDELKLGKDGYFSVILSAERPAGYTGDWWKLHPVTNSLLMRKNSADWRKEEDPKIAIERLDEAPARTPEETARRFSNLKAWVAGRIIAEINGARFYRENIGINVIKQSPTMKAANPFPGQMYLDGAFEIKDDEALIVEVPVPKTCRYWQILLTDSIFKTIDWVNHQSSLNDAQARVDKDGYFRAVVSPRDPGVPNWLDTNYEPWGLMQMRWNRCSSQPEPEVRRVALKDVRKYIPADTPVVTPAERKQQLQQRREAAQFRRLW